jgi:hypothetical protein
MLAIVVNTAATRTNHGKAPQLGVAPSSWKREYAVAKRPIMKMKATSEESEARRASSENAGDGYIRRPLVHRIGMRDTRARNVKPQAEERTVRYSRRSWKRISLTDGNQN